MPRGTTRLMYDGPGLAGVTTSLGALGWGGWELWLPDEPDTDRAVRRIAFEGTPLVIDKNSPSSIYRGGPLDARDPQGGSARSNYARSRRDSLRELDGIVFVADSQRARQEANLARIDGLLADLRFVGRSPELIPLVFQLNKRDLRGSGPAEVLSADTLRATLSWPGPCRYVPSSAARREGVAEAVLPILELIRSSERSGA